MALNLGGNTLAECWIEGGKACVVSAHRDSSQGHPRACNAVRLRFRQYLTRKPTSNTFQIAE